MTVWTGERSRSHQSAIQHQTVSPEIMYAYTHIATVKEKEARGHDFDRECKGGGAREGLEGEKERGK